MVRVWGVGVFLRMTYQIYGKKSYLFDVGF